MAGTTGTHDLGGLEDDGAIDIASGNKKYQLWELQTHCLVTLLCKQGLLTVDEVRCIAPLLYHRVQHSIVASGLVLAEVLDLPCRSGEVLRGFRLLRSNL